MFVFKVFLWDYWNHKIVIKMFYGISLSAKIKSGKNIMYAFTIMVHVANVYIILLPDFTKFIKL